MALISREPLRTEIRRLLIGRIMKGEFEPGTYPNEVELTETIGVSRTPLREALLQLVFEGFLESVPGKGFKVRPLTIEEARELFAVGKALEVLALRMAGGATESQVSELEEINRKRARMLRSGEDQATLVEIDDEWHRRLVTGCDNRQLLELTKLIRNRLYRYIYAFEGHPEEVEKAIKDHERIHDALRNDELEAAVELLKKHWIEAEETIIELMEENG